MLDVQGTLARTALVRIAAGWHDSCAALLLESPGFMPDSFVQRECIGPHRVLVLTDASGAHRVYASGALRFINWNLLDQASDSQGGRWRVSEDAMIGPRGQTLPRLPAHRAFWFGWYAAYPHTRLVK